MSTLKIMKVATLKNDLHNHSQYLYLAKMKISLYIRLLFVLCYDLIKLSHTKLQYQ